MDLVKKFRFEAAHHLPKFPEGHKCRRLHGHSFSVKIMVRGHVDEDTGIIRDFADLSDAWAPLFDELDHRYLNKVEGLENPTAENIAYWIWDRLYRSLHSLSMVEVYETCTSGVSFFGWNRPGSKLWTASRYRDEAMKGAPETP